jgi:hypothetical protein
MRRSASSWSAPARRRATSAPTRPAWRGRSWSGRGPPASGGVSPGAGGRGGAMVASWGRAAGAAAGTRPSGPPCPPSPPPPPDAAHAAASSAPPAPVARAPTPKTGLLPSLILVVNPAVQYALFEWGMARAARAKARAAARYDGGGRRAGRAGPGGAPKPGPMEVFLIGGLPACTLAAERSPTAGCCRRRRCAAPPTRQPALPAHSNTSHPQPPCHPEKAPSPRSAPRWLRTR